MPSGTSITALLPLVISGYFFNLIFYPTRYFCVRVDGQRLFFISAGTGLVLGAVGFFLASAIAATAAYRCSIFFMLAAELARAIPFPYASKLLFTIAFSIALAYTLNFASYLWFRPTGVKVAKHIYGALVQRHGSPLAQLFRKATEQHKLVMLTLKSKKIYCGRVLEVPTNLDIETAYVEILPKFSGYRDKDTLRMGPERTEYPAITLWESKRYLDGRRKVLKELEWREESFRRKHPTEVEALVEEKEKIKREISQLEALISEARAPDDFSIDDWIKVIPVKEIETATFYDPKAYSTWFTTKPAPLNANRRARPIR